MNDLDCLKIVGVNPSPRIPRNMRGKEDTALGRARTATVNAASKLVDKAAGKRVRNNHLRDLSTTFAPVHNGSGAYHTGGTVPITGTAGTITAPIMMTSSGRPVKAVKRIFTETQVEVTKVKQLPQMHAGVSSITNPLGRSSNNESKKQLRKGPKTKSDANVKGEPKTKKELKVISEPKVKVGKNVKKVSPQEDGDTNSHYDPATAPFLVITAPSEKKESDASINKQLTKMKKNLMYKVPTKKFHKAGMHAQGFQQSPTKILGSEPAEKFINMISSVTNWFKHESAKVEEVPSLTVPLNTASVMDEVRLETSDTDGSTSGRELEPQPKSAASNESTTSVPTTVTTDYDEIPRGTYKSERLQAFKNSKRRNSLLPEPSWWAHDNLNAPAKKKSKKLEIEFHLPYDLYVSSLEKAEMKNVTKKYRKLRQNTFVDIKPYSDFDTDENICECKKPSDDEKGCGPDCLNRCMLIECDPKKCPCGDKCSNQRMLNNEWTPGLQRFMTQHCGWGVRTTEKIKEGDFILEYIGEIVSLKLFADRMVNMYHNDSHHYCLSLGPNIVIDGYRAANEGRFVNHSCEPNCAMQKWSVNGMYRMGLFAARDIEPGEELSYDYNFDSYNVETQQVCTCGSKKCRGVIGGRSKGNDRRGSSDASTTGTKSIKGRKKKKLTKNRPKESKEVSIPSSDLITTIKEEQTSPLESNEVDCSSGVVPPETVDQAQLKLKSETENVVIENSVQDSGIIQLNGQQ